MTKDEARKALLETLEEYCHDKGYNLQVFAGMADWVYTLYPKEKAMTNADKIRAMSDEERDKFYYDKGYNKAIEQAVDLARKPNKMQIVAAQFGKKLNERFTVRYDNYLFDCQFAECGFVTCGAYDNPYLDFDAFLLQDLLVGRAVIVDE